MGLRPLPYHEANHWEPEDIPMGKDIEQWRSAEITDIERWIIRMGIGYFQPLRALLVIIFSTLFVSWSPLLS